MSKASLLWLDLEMTGIDPANSRIIEVGIIATDWDLNEIAEYQSIVQQSQDTLNKADDWVKQNMRPLLDKVPKGKPEREVVAEIVEFVGQHFDMNQPIYLAGNSIHQDRRFIRAYWPQIENFLHYRMLDVSAWKIVMKNKFDVDFNKREQHRALEDIRGSIEEFTLYLDKIPQLNTK